MKVMSCRGSSPPVRPGFISAVLCLALTGCGGSGSNSGLSGSSSSSSGGSGASGSRGSLLNAPTLINTLSASSLQAQLSTTANAEVLVLSGNPVCDTGIYHVEYNTVGGAGEATTASAALMVPSGADARCTGARPILLYAHGTTTDRTFDIADLSNSDNAEGLFLAAFFASRGYIVVAPNYTGYDTSSLGYHPFLIAAAQADDMTDALTAARSSLPSAYAPGTIDGGRLFITGYSEGGYVAMATQRAMQAAGVAVTAAAPMSGPYALAAFVDAVFYGEVNQGAPIDSTLLFTGYQHAYGNIYSAASDLFAPQYATGIATLLPSTESRSQLYTDGLLPQNALFSSTPPAPSYASITPPTTPAAFAAVYAAGFAATDFLVNNSYRLSYLQDAQANPDGGFPTVSSGIAAPSPGLPARQALSKNDLRDWVPTAPTLLCGGDQDPTVFFFNTQLMQSYWTVQAPSSSAYSVLDLEAAATSGDLYASEKSQFSTAKQAVATAAVVGGASDGGASAVASAYHSTLVPPFCLAAVSAFFAAQP